MRRLYRGLAKAGFIPAYSKSFGETYFPYAGSVSRRLQIWRAYMVLCGRKLPGVRDIKEKGGNLSGLCYYRGRGDRLVLSGNVCSVAHRKRLC